MRKIGTSLRAALKFLPVSTIPLPPEIEISWISSAEMRRIHAEFLNDPSRTDVITFQHGEILICPQVAQEEAGRHEHSFREELLFYAVHGLLHLLGWTDQRAIDRKKMHLEQARILKLII